MGNTKLLVSGLLGASLLFDTFRAKPFEQGVVTRYLPPALCGRCLFAVIGDGHIHIGQSATLGAVHMIVPLSAFIKPTRLIRERKFLNQIVLGQ